MDLHHKNFPSYSDEESISSPTNSSGSDLSFQKFKNNKCIVITLVKSQIITVDKRFLAYHEEVQWCNSLPGRLYRHKYKFLSLIVMLILLYVALIYGAIFGASVCAKGMRGSCCNVGYVPGLKYIPNKYSPY